MSRKSPSFRQLIDYMSDIDKSDEKYNVYQNIFSRSAEEIVEEFLNNSNLMDRRKNGNQMYHEILSITKSGKLKDRRQKEILRNVAYQYAQRRAGSNLAFGCLHDDHDHHLHYHLLISANGAGEAKRHRLSKAQFNKLKRVMELDVLEKYPELDQKVVINISKEDGDAKTKSAKRQEGRKTRKPSQKQILKSKIAEILKDSKSWEEFSNALKQAGFEFYMRGNTAGVREIENGKGHRLKTLGLLEAYQDFAGRADQKASEKKPESSPAQEDEKKPESQKQAKAKSERAPAKEESTENQMTQKAEHRKEEARKTRERNQASSSSASRSRKK